MFYTLLFVYGLAGYAAQQWFMGGWYKTIGFYLADHTQGTPLLYLWDQYGQYMVPAIFLVTACLHIFSWMNKVGMSGVIEDADESNYLLSKSMENGFDRNK